MLDYTISKQSIVFQRTWYVKYAVIPTSGKGLEKHGSLSHPDRKIEQLRPNSSRGFLLITNETNTQPNKKF